MPHSRFLKTSVIFGTALALALAACSPPTGVNEELRKELQALKSEVQALKEKLGQVEARQQTILDMLKKTDAAPETAAPPPMSAPPAAPEVLSVSQLLAGKERFIGTRVTVRGPVGPVLMHHKSLMLKAPEGMVEVAFGSLPDQKLVQRLTSTPLETPLTVTGMVSLPSKVGGAKLQISAEAVEF